MTCSRSYSNYGGISRWHVSDLLRDRITLEKRLLEIKNRFLCTRHNLPCISHLLLCLSLHLSSPFLYCLFHKTGDTTSCLPAQYAPSAHPLCSHTCYNRISDTGLQTLGSAMDLSVQRCHLIEQEQMIRHRGKRLWTFLFNENRKIVNI